MHLIFKQLFSERAGSQLIIFNKRQLFISSIQYSLKLNRLNSSKVFKTNTLYIIVTSYKVRKLYKTNTVPDFTHFPASCWGIQNKQDEYRGDFAAISVVILRCKWFVHFFFSLKLFYLCQWFTAPFLLNDLRILVRYHFFSNTAMKRATERIFYLTKITKIKLIVIGFFRSFSLVSF